MASKNKNGIKYISPEIPPVTFPAIEGESYEALTPDTLDLAERADYGIHCATNIADPEADYEIWWHALLNRKPPVLVHDFHDLHIQFKFQEALPLLRSITGNTSKPEVDQAWAEALLRMQGEDGLTYMPIKGRPWARFNAEWLNEEGWEQGDQLGAMVCNGGLIGVMGLYFQLSGDELWKQRGRRLVDRMAQLVGYKDDYAYLSVLCVLPGAELTPDMPMINPENTGEASGSVAGWIINGLCRLYQPTGYEPALDLAGKLSTYLMKHAGCYDVDGRFLGIPHTHQHTRPISGLLEYALIAENEEMIEFCRKSYEYAKTACGNDTIGFFPATPGPDATMENATIQNVCWHPAEGCTIADMVALSIKLSVAGVGDYWDDADRYLRNHFAEMQMLRTDWVNRVPPELPTDVWVRPEFETADRTMERNIGACMSMATPNDFVGHPYYYDDRPPVDHLFLMHCCTGNYLRAIWYAWDNILDYNDGKLRINLLLNRASAWADVASYIPYEGQVDVTMKERCSVSIRIPEWVQPAETTCLVGGQPRQLGWDGRYAQIGDVNAGDAISLIFPISERDVKVKSQYEPAARLAGTTYTMTIKGNTVVRMDPSGQYYPLYQRSHLRENRVRWVKRSRFVSSRPAPQWSY